MYNGTNICVSILKTSGMCFAPELFLQGTLRCIRLTYLFVNHLLNIGILATLNMLTDQLLLTLHGYFGL